MMNRMKQGDLRHGAPVADADRATAELTRARWEANAAYWVTVIREGRDRYRTELTDPAILDAIGPCAGLTVLDAGCGEGYLSRILASRGADVVGVDVCQGLIEAAARVSGRQRTGPDQATALTAGEDPADAPAATDHATAPGGRAPDGVMAGPRSGGQVTGPAPGERGTGGTRPARFLHASVGALPLADEALDLVVCNHLFSHLHDPSGAVREFGRVLKAGGRLVILTLHPCFYTDGSEQGAADGVPASRYFTSRGVDQHFLVDGLRSPSVITSWLRPLEYYSATLRDAGFVITDIREPRPADDLLHGDPWWRDGFPTALFILLTAERRQSPRQRES
jgi:SAM-dependent methyltransferase